jgi:Nucleotidyl transferase AbiEii toxin, Type IV TA system
MNEVPVWHQEPITPEVAQTLEDLVRLSVLTGFYLAGGTGLALQYGHRRSVDLDFFSSAAFNEDLLLSKAQSLPGFSVIGKAEQTLHVQIRGVKVSFLGYAYPVLFPFGTFLGAHVADPRDIACMKISAIASRGTKRDFVDLYWSARRYGLDQLLRWFKEKFAQANYNPVHVLKSLTYFQEAEKDPLPDMLVTLSWKEVKEFFKRETPRLL